MVISEINNKQVWENFLLGCQEKTFLQSWNWGEFQKLMGNKIWRIGVYDRQDSTSETLSGVVLVTKIQAKRGTFLQVQHWLKPAEQGEALEELYSSRPFAGRAPSEAGDEANPQRPARERDEMKSQRALGFSETLLDKLKEIAREEGCSFIRVAPLLERNEENKKLFKDLGFHNSPMHANAYEMTFKLELSFSEEELLMNMRKTTRYLIRQAMKNPDLKIVKSDKIEDVELYNKLNQEVARHQKFVPFSFDFIKKEFEVFSRDNQALLFFGRYKEEVAAGALIIFWSDIGFYHQAALDPKYHKIPIAYLLQWEAIKEAKNRGCKLYDFWGGYLDPKLKHPWAGPTLFKMGFGGRLYQYLKTQDFPLSKKYWLTYIFEKLRKIKRGL